MSKIDKDINELWEALIRLDDWASDIINDLNELQELTSASIKLKGKSSSSHRSDYINKRTILQEKFLAVLDNFT